MLQLKKNYKTKKTKKTKKNQTKKKRKKVQYKAGITHQPLIRMDFVYSEKHPHHTTHNFRTLFEA